MNRRWTEDKIRRLRELAREGKTAAEAGRYFGVSEKAVVFQGWRYKIRFKGAGRGYQPHEDAIIKDMVAKGYAWTAISKHLPGRTPEGVAGRGKALGLKLCRKTSPLTISKPVSNETRKKRHCLKCGDDFMSEWAGERICSPCKQSAEWRTGGVDYGVLL